MLSCYSLYVVHTVLDTQVLKKAGMEGKDTVFLFTDTQIIAESYLEDINNILNAGEVGGFKFEPVHMVQIELLYMGLLGVRVRHADHSGGLTWKDINTILKAGEVGGFEIVLCMLYMWWWWWWVGGSKCGSYKLPCQAKPHEHVHTQICMYAHPGAQPVRE